MPKIALEIEETYDNITRPVTSGIIRDLINRLGLPNDTSLAYYGSAEDSANKGSVLAQQNAAVKFPFTDRVKIDVDEQYVDDHVLTTPVHQHAQRKIFADDGLGVYIRPVYQRTRSVVSMTYRASDKTTALRWRDNFRRKSAEGRESLLHEVIYHFTPPMPFFGILQEIHRLREQQWGYGEDFTTWVADHFTERLTNLSTLDGHRTLPAVTEKQIGIQGWFDFEAQPDNPSKESDGGSWTLTVSYTFEYDKVTSMTMDYPIVVHNQLLSSDYVPMDKTYDLYEQAFRQSPANDSLSLFTPHRRVVNALYEHIVIPAHDDWYPAKNSKRLITLISALVGVDPENPTLIASLADFGEVGIDPGVVEYLRKERMNIKRYTANAFHVEFFRGRYPQDPASLMIDADLNLYSTVPLDPRNIYHLRFSVTKDLRTLSDEAKDSLRKDPPTCGKVVDLIDDIQNPDKPMPVGSGRYPDSRPSIPDLVGRPPYDDRENENGQWEPENPLKPSLPWGQRPGSGDPLGPDDGSLSGNLDVIGGGKGKWEWDEEEEDWTWVGPTTGGGLVTEDSLEDTINKLPSGPGLGTVGRGRGLKTVMFSGIIAHKR